jgi:hypothetical protein
MMDFQTNNSQRDGLEGKKPEPSPRKPSLNQGLVRRLWIATAHQGWLF